MPALSSRPPSESVRAIILFAAVCVAACGTQSTGPQLGQRVDMRINTVVRFPSDTTTARFTDVAADSRCPGGALCIWAGDAVVQFTIGGTRQVALHLNPTAGDATVFVGAYRLTLVALAPSPVVGTSINKSDYVVTIRFDGALD